jgi:glycine betaine catabolism A
MTTQTTLSLIESRKPRCAMPSDVYFDDQVYQDDLKHVWYATWIFAGHTFELPKPGSFMTLEIGDYPVVIVRNKDGHIRAFHNVCRHRGHRVCVERSGQAARLRCPYHQWTYDYDGKLIYAAQMGNSFDPSQFSLSPIHVGVSESYIFVCVAENAPDFDNFAKSFAPFVAPHDPDQWRVAHMTTAVEHGNWKLVFENNRECFHCSSNHPELLRSYEENASVSGGEPDEDPELIAFLDACENAGLKSRFYIDHLGQYRITRIPLNHGAQTFTMDGKPVLKKTLLDRFNLDHMGALMMFHYPNTWNHWLCDHALSFRILPLGKDKTQIVTRWLVPRDATEGVDYDFEHLTHVWEMTNAQDTRLVEECARGLKSPSYAPGPFSDTEENGVCQFVDWYCNHMTRALTKQTTTAS